MMTEQEADELVQAARALQDRTLASQERARWVVGLLINVQRGLARDVIEVAALVAPANDAEGELLRGACERAQMVLDRFGTGDQARHQ